MRTLIRSALLLSACLLTAGCAARNAQQSETAAYDITLSYKAPSLPPEIHLISEPENETTIIPVVQLDLNTASASELSRLPEVDEALAQRIVEYRNRSGGYSSTEQLMQIRGMTRARLQRLQPWIEVNGEISTDKVANGELR